MCAENIVGNRVSDLYCVLVRIFYTNQSSYTHAALGNNFYAPVWKKKVCIYNHSASFHSYNALFKNGIAHIG